MFPSDTSSSAFREGGRIFILLRVQSHLMTAIWGGTVRRMGHGSEIPVEPREDFAGNILDRQGVTFVECNVLFVLRPGSQQVEQGPLCRLEWLLEVIAPVQHQRR